MILGAGGGGRGVPAMAPGHPGAVGMRGGDVGTRGSAKTVGWQGGSLANPPFQVFSGLFAIASSWKGFGAPNNQRARGERRQGRNK